MNNKELLEDFKEHIDKLFDEYKELKLNKKFRESSIKQGELLGVYESIYILVRNKIINSEQYGEIVEYVEMKRSLVK